METGCEGAEEGLLAAGVKTLRRNDDAAPPFGPDTRVETSSAAKNEPKASFRTAEFILTPMGREPMGRAS
jgi:hypothetical protein